MIIFEIYSNIPQIPSQEVTLYFSEFLIGAQTNCDLRLPRSCATSMILKAKQTDKGLIIRGGSSDIFFVDGKKIQGSKLVLPKQIIKLGETSFIIKENNYDRVNHVLDIGTQYEKFGEEKSEYFPILEAIEKEILYAEEGLKSPKVNSDLDL